MTACGQHSKRNPYLYETINHCQIPFPHRDPVRPASVKNYSSKYDSFWCCTGTGMQAPAKFGKMIYSASGDTLFVNMFISSDLQWKDKKVSLTMETAFPADDKVMLAIGSGGGKRFALAIRHPRWDRLPRLPLWPGPSRDKDRGSVPGAGGLPSTDKSADQQEG